MNKEVKRTFTPGPMVSFRTPLKIKSYLVRAKLYPLKKNVGSRKSGKKRREVCENVNNYDNFAGSMGAENAPNNILEKLYTTLG